MNPQHYFDAAGSGTIWDIVLTHPLQIRHVKIGAVEHPSCIPEKCNGTAVETNRRTLREIAKEEFLKMLKRSLDYELFLERFPIAEGEDVELPELE